MEREIRTDLRDQVLWVTLARAERMNALSPTMLDDLAAELDRAESDEAVRCLVLTGEGRAFCAGADLSSVPSDADGLASFVAHAAAVTSRLEAFSKPTIACVNGLALAGGLELLLCTDIVVAARGAEIGDGHVRLGLLPGAGGSVRLLRAVGLARARYLLFSGARLPAQTAEAWGLVQQLCDGGDLVGVVQELAQRIASYSPLVLKRMKALVASAADLSLEAALQAELDANRAHARSHDLREGLAAFRERRQPVFRGA
jgi:enoyl-CoA hydratase